MADDDVEFRISAIPGDAGVRYGWSLVRLGYPGSRHRIEIVDRLAVSDPDWTYETPELARAAIEDVRRSLDARIAEDVFDEQ
ncbi:MAG TPA: hypothetical protein VGH10_03895 [Actinomycetota bacterium]|jgi:hypothetical protein